jgi:hypothetical protein
MTSISNDKVMPITTSSDKVTKFVLSSGGILNKYAVILQSSGKLKYYYIYLGNEVTYSEISEVSKLEGDSL